MHMQAMQGDRQCKSTKGAWKHARSTAKIKTGHSTGISSTVLNLTLTPPTYWMPVIKETPFLNENLQECNDPTQRYCSGQAQNRATSTSDSRATLPKNVGPKRKLSHYLAASAALFNTAPLFLCSAQSFLYL